METNFNFNSQPATSIEQSMRLLALGLKKETADMYWTNPFGDWIIIVGGGKIDEDNIPAWTLYRLIKMIPKDIVINSDVIFPFRRTALTDLIDNDCDLFEGLVQIIERGVKEGYFNKEYLNETTED